MAGISIAEFKQVKSDVDQHEKFINGNGNGSGSGAKTRLALVEDNLKEIKDTLKWLRGAVTGLIATVVGAVIIWLVLTGIPKIAGS
jgi:hypothetical protein